jgi:hypothetical protein
MRIHSKPKTAKEEATTVALTRCTISKVVSAKGKVQITLETELSDDSLLEDVKILVGLSAGEVDVIFRERPEAEAEDGE